MHFKIYIYFHKLIHEIFWISHLWQGPNKVSIYHSPGNVFCMHKVGVRS